MKQIFSILIFSFWAVLAVAQKSPIFSTGGVAIGGYDPVAYFTMGKPAAGADQWSLVWNGSTWKFVSEANLLLFKANPDKYAPQYGGYCAYGCSENHLSPTDPNAWTIVDNKLYLNYSMKVKALWVKDSVSRIQKANAYWLSIKQ